MFHGVHGRTGDIARGIGGGVSNGIKERRDKDKKLKILLGTQARMTSEASYKAVYLKSAYTSGTRGAARCTKLV